MSRGLVLFYLKSEALPLLTKIEAIFWIFLYGLN
jgi:hypothetical protein